MKTGRRDLGWLEPVRRWMRRPEPAAGEAQPPPPPVRIGLALGGGFARGIAHAGVFRVFEQHRIPVDCIAGVSAGSIAAAAFASGATPLEIAEAARSMRFTDVARWSIGRLGFVGSERMTRFLQRLLKTYRFEEMRIPLAVLATDLITGEPVIFRDRGDVCMPIRASCSYPGLFRPVRDGDRMLVDGAMSGEVPASVVRTLGATRVISVHLPAQRAMPHCRNMFQVVNRCFQIMQQGSEQTWRQHSDLVIAPDVGGVEWDGFANADQLLAAGENAALAALPQILKWLDRRDPRQDPAPSASAVPVMQ